MRLLALACSVLLHPLLLLNAGMLIILRYHPYYRSKFYDEQFSTIMLFVAVNTLIMPLLTIFLLKKFRLVGSIMLSDPKQRLLPYIITTLLMGFTAYELYKNEFGGLPLVFLMSTIICLLLNILINIKFKISSHAISAGGLLGLFIYLVVFGQSSDFNNFLTGSIIVAGISGWARLRLGAHTEAQVYSGYALGLTVVLGTCYIATFFI